MGTFYKKINDEVFYPAEDLVTMEAARLSFLKQQALVNPRQRARFCAHQEMGDSLHEMFIVHTKEAYVRPHKHLSKSESMYVIEGEVDIILFDDSGKVARIIEMGTPASGKVFYYRIAQPVFHTLRIKSEVICFHEVINGPFDRSDTFFPSWAPDGLDLKVAREYMRKIDGH